MAKEFETKMKNLKKVVDNWLKRLKVVNWWFNSFPKKKHSLGKRKDTKIQSPATCQSHRLMLVPRRETKVVHWPRPATAPKLL